MVTVYRFNPQTKLELMVVPPRQAMEIRILNGGAYVSKIQGANNEVVHHVTTHASRSPRKTDVTDYGVKTE